MLFGRRSEPVLPGGYYGSSSTGYNGDKSRRMDFRRYRLVIAMVALVVIVYVGYSFQSVSTSMRTRLQGAAAVVSGSRTVETASASASATSKNNAKEDPPCGSKEGGGGKAGEEDGSEGCSRRDAPTRGQGQRWSSLFVDENTASASAGTTADDRRRMATMADTESSTFSSSSSVSPFYKPVRWLSPSDVDERRHHVREAFKHAYGSYAAYAFGADEVRPVSKGAHNGWGGWGATIVDSLDTMMLMDMKEEVAKAREHVKTINWKKDVNISFFETIIRYLGGLLGAFELSRDSIYLTKAKELADLLLPTFSLTQANLPQSIVNTMKGTAHNHGWTGSQSILAEVGSLQLEFSYLSHHTGDPKYHEAGRRIFDNIAALPSVSSKIKGLYPIYLDPKTGRSGGYRITFGSFADSFYEYLLKLYILSSNKDLASLRMYLDSTDAFRRLMVRRRVVAVDPKLAFEAGLVPEQGDGTAPSSPPSAPVNVNVAFVGDLTPDGSFTPTMEHLTCFTGGLFALGAAHIQSIAAETMGPEQEELLARAESDLQLGAEITAMCYLSYVHTPTGLGPEAFSMQYSRSDAEAEEAAQQVRVSTTGAAQTTASTSPTSAADAALKQIIAEERAGRTLGSASADKNAQAATASATVSAQSAGSAASRPVRRDVGTGARTLSAEEMKQLFEAHRLGQEPGNQDAVGSGNSNRQPGAGRALLAVKSPSIASLVTKIVEKGSVADAVAGRAYSRRSAEVLKRLKKARANVAAPHTAASSAATTTAASAAPAAPAVPSAPVAVAAGTKTVTETGIPLPSAFSQFEIDSVPEVEHNHKKKKPHQTHEGSAGAKQGAPERPAIALKSMLPPLPAKAQPYTALFSPDQRKYILRPETLESIFLMHRVTGHDKYRVWGWNIFRALERSCKTAAGYSGVYDVTRQPGEANNLNNAQESFFLAETLKYLYLLYSPAEVLPLDKFVLNTEAHVLGLIPQAVYQYPLPPLPQAQAMKAEQK